MTNFVGTTMRSESEVKIGNVVYPSGSLCTMLDEYYMDEDYVSLSLIKWNDSVISEVNGIAFREVSPNDGIFDIGDIVYNNRELIDNNITVLLGCTGIIKSIKFNYCNTYMVQWNEGETMEVIGEYLSKTRQIPKIIRPDSYAIKNEKDLYAENIQLQENIAVISAGYVECFKKLCGVMKKLNKLRNSYED